MRTATVERKTREVEVAVSLDLDGSGDADVDTGIGFLDHMLECLGRHSLIDLKVRAQGDLHVDYHHTCEHAAIFRFGHALIPMDEALTRVALDIANRPCLVWRVEIPRPKLGQMDTELFREWFRAFAQNAGLCLHVETLYGQNSHHIVESYFKALARALRQAIAPDDRLEGAVASVTGMIVED